MSKFLDPKTIKKYYKHQEPPNLDELKNKGEQYVAPYFPPTINSIIGKNPSGKMYDPTNEGIEKIREMEEEDEWSTIDKYTWKRASEKRKDWKVFEGSIEMEDVSQGNMGDCYFLTTISALPNYPYLIKSLFRTDEYNELGYYELILFIDGEWQVVIIDDFFPYDPKERNIRQTSPLGSSKRKRWFYLYRRNGE